MCDLLGPVLKPVSPALAGGFLSSAPPGKSQTLVVLSLHFFYSCCVPSDGGVDLLKSRTKKLQQGGESRKTV